MLHQLADNGTMAVILPHGALFRGGSEGAIRRILIEERNWLDAVIGLPANIFYGTAIPTCIMVFKKCRENPDDVLFIDASGPGNYEKAKNQNILRDCDVKRIIDTYRSRTAEDRYSHVATMTEIEENDWNLNIPRYVDTFEDEAPVELSGVLAELKAIDGSMAEVDARIADFCKELGIEAPL
jgi:type I restriction enzyme M protein